MRTARGVWHHGCCCTIAPRCALVLSCRGYYWPYSEDFVPKGANTSRFQSSSVPSERMRVLREYAFSPLFAARTPCCILGFACPARDVMPCKPALRTALATLFDCTTEDELELGVVQQTKEMMLHRSGLYESPRLGDGPGSSREAAVRRRTRYARQPVRARTLLEVYLRRSNSEELTRYVTRGHVSDCDDEEEIALLHAHGSAVQDALTQTPLSTSEKNNEVIITTTTSNNGKEAQAEAVRELRRLGVVYCELPEVDESGFYFDELFGEATEAATVSRIVARWQEKLAEGTSPKDSVVEDTVKS